MNTHTGIFFPPFNVEYMYMDFYEGCYKTLPLGGASSSVFNDTYNQQDSWKQNILPMDLYNTSRCSIYNHHLLNMENILFTGAL